MKEEEVSSSSHEIPSGFPLNFLRKLCLCQFGTKWNDTQGPEPVMDDAAVSAWPGNLALKHSILKIKCLWTVGEFQSAAYTPYSWGCGHRAGFVPCMEKTRENLLFLLELLEIPKLHLGISFQPPHCSACAVGLHCNCSIPAG